MDTQRKSLKNVLFSLRTACIIIGIAELFLYPLQASAFMYVIPAKRYVVLRVGAASGFVVAVNSIVGAVKRNVNYLGLCILFNVICVLAVPILYYVFVVYNDPGSSLEETGFLIHKAFIFMLIMIQIAFTYVIYRLICEIRDVEHGRIHAPVYAVPESQSF